MCNVYDKETFMAYVQKYVDEGLLRMVDYWNDDLTYNAVYVERVTAEYNGYYRYIRVSHFDDDGVYIREDGYCHNVYYKELKRKIRCLAKV